MPEALPPQAAGPCVILDCGLSTTGHHATLLRQVVDSLTTRESGALAPDNIVVLTNTNAGTAGLPHIDIRPVLPFTGYEGFGFNPFLIPEDPDPSIRAARDLSLALLDQDDLLAEACEIHVLNVTPMVLLTLAYWTRLRCRKLAGRLALYCLYSLGGSLRRIDGHVAWAEISRRDRLKARYALNQIEAACPQLSYGVYSADRACELATLTHRPITRLSLAPPRPNPIETMLEDSFICLYLGAAKYEKGFFDLPELVDMALAQSWDQRFFIQFTTQDPAHLWVVQQLLERAANNPRLVVENSFLPPMLYNKIIGRAQAIVLAYKLEIYANRSSGIVEEALRAGTPAIYPQNSHMAETMASLGAPNNAVPQSTPADMIAGLAQILAGGTASRTNLASAQRKLHARDQGLRSL